MVRPIGMRSSAVHMQIHSVAAFNQGYFLADLLVYVL